MESTRSIAAEQSGAFVETFELPPTADGPLAGLTFAVKDLIDVAGRPTGCGNPTWRDTHPPASVHAVCVEQLLASGARCVGKTVTDEMAFSLIGENHFYGTPLNPAAPDRVPGGSSSGSASAVACGLADFAFGTDTGGSVRVPASNCGLWGLRPSHGSGQKYFAGLGIQDRTMHVDDPIVLRVQGARPPDSILAADPAVSHRESSRLHLWPIAAVCLWAKRLPVERHSKESSSPLAADILRSTCTPQAWTQRARRTRARIRQGQTVAACYRWIKKCPPNARMLASHVECPRQRHKSRHGQRRPVWLALPAPESASRAEPPRWTTSNCPGPFRPAFRLPHSETGSMFPTGSRARR